MFIVQIPLLNAYGEDIYQPFLTVFWQPSPTQVGETLSFSENSLNFSKKSLSLFKRMVDFSKIPWFSLILSLVY